MNKRKLNRNKPRKGGDGKKRIKPFIAEKVLKTSKRYDDSLADKIIAAGALAIEQDESSVIKAIDDLNSYLSLKNISNEHKINILINLANAYKHRGDHKQAIETLDKLKIIIGKHSKKLLLHVKIQYAISLAALGYLDEACNSFDEIINEIEGIDIQPLMAGGLYLEAGKAHTQINQIEKAEKYWNKACSIFENLENEVEHLARAKANLGSLLLNNENKAKQEEGVQLIKESSNLKRMVGDLDGLAANYCNLGLYYWKQKKYERAIAFTRKDLFFSRKVGDLRAIGSTLGNLAGIYTEMKQLSPARKLLNEAISIGKKLKDERLIAISEHNLKQINVKGEIAGANGEVIGPSALCACNSNKEYQHCCGRADFEPIDIQMEFGGISEEIEPIIKKISDSGNEPSRLDFIFRDVGDSEKLRLAWTRHHIHDGWFEMHELPDMANHHLIAARIFANEANDSKDNDYSIHKPLACLILSACALEAFINQVSYFLNEVQNFPEKKLHEIPPELQRDVWEFQRTTELSKKWEILGQALCKRGWPPPTKMWNDFKILIYVRNELVHFKIDKYEQVIPPEKNHTIIDKVPKEVEIRNIPHAWPSRLLTPSFANWAVNLAEAIIRYFKKAYIDTRMTKSINIEKPNE